MEGVDLVVAHYHHLLDPFVREQFFRWLGRDPEDVVAVFDEAHNVEETAREKASKSLAEVTLDGALSELEDVDDYRAEAAENVVRAFRDALVATYEDGMTEFERESVGEDWRLTVAVPDGLARYVVEKGSIAVDGISLTIAARNEDSFEVAIIPETYELTTLSEKSVGDPVHLEVDVLAKYVERMLDAEDADPQAAYAERVSGE